MYLQNPHDGSDVWYHGTLQRLSDDLFNQMSDNADATYFASIQQDAELLACRDVENSNCAPIVYLVKIKLCGKKVLDAKNLFSSTPINDSELSDEGQTLFKTMLDIGGDDIEEDLEHFLDSAQSYSYRAFDPTANPLVWISEEFYEALGMLGYFGWFEREEEISLGNGLNVGILAAQQHIEVVGILGV